MLRLNAAVALAAILLAAPLPAKAEQAAWTLDFEEGIASGRKVCSLLSAGGELMVALYSTPDRPTPRWLVMAAGPRLQKSATHWLRVGEHRYQTSGISGAFPRGPEIVDQLLASPSFAIEWVELWNKPHSAVVSTGDIRSKADSCERMFR